MGFKCLPQITGLVRNSPPATAKHRANGLKILQELGRERYSKSVTLDRSRSQDNIYEGFNGRGTECWTRMEQTANDYRIVGEFKTGKRKGETFSRALREDAVIGWAMIFNPPHDVSKDWNESTFDRFYADSFACMEEIEPRLFRRKNLCMTAIHKDEGIDSSDEHKHFVGMSVDEDGRFCGNLIDASLCVRINELYPELMRSRGWEIDNPDMTDFKRMGTDAAYKAERQAREPAGQSVNKHIAGKKKKAEQELQAAREAAEAILSDAKQQAEEIRQKAIEDASRDAQRASKAILERARIEADKIWDEAGKDVKKYKGYAEIGKRISEKTRKSDKDKQQSTAKPTEKRRIVSKSRIYDSLSQKRGAEADAFLGIGAGISRQTEDFEKK